MKVLHVIPSISESTGGPARSSQGLVAALEGSGIEAWLVVFNQRDTPWIDGVQRFKRVEQNGYQRRKKEFEQIVDEITPCIIHIHCIWDVASHIASTTARQKDIPYIIAPRGMLEPWGLNQKKWKKRLAMCLYQKSDLKKAVSLHATAQSEADQFRRLGFTQNIIVSPNGITLPNQIPIRAYRKDGKRVVLFLSRIHPKKGLLLLIEAIARLKKMSSFHGWHVEYAGPDYEGHLSEMQDHIASLGLQNDFTYLGNLDDERKWDVYSRADLFVLPTYSENFGIVVPEALHAGVPVITTQGTPWEELETEHCGWWVDIGVEHVAAALHQGMALSDEEREQMGRNGRTLVEQKYTWEGAAKKMRIAYEEIMGKTSSVM